MTFYVGIKGNVLKFILLMDKEFLGELTALQETSHCPTRSSDELKNNLQGNRNIITSVVDPLGPFSM